MSYALGFLLGSATFMKKHSKVLIGLFFIYLSVIYIYATNIPDRPLYQLQYDYSMSFISEPLYNGFAWIFRWFHMGYPVYRAFLCFLGLGLITKTFMDFSPYPATVLCLYFIYPFCIDVVQVRSFVATAIAFFSIRFLIKYQLDNKMINVLWFGLCIIAAAGFHYSAILYGIVGILFFNIKKHVITIFSILPLIAIVIALNIPFIMSLIYDVIGEHKAELWVEKQIDTSLIRLIRLIVSRGGIILLILVFSGVVKNKDYKLYKEEVNNDEKELKEAETNILFYDKKIDDCLTKSIILIFIYTVFDIFIAGDYERLSRLGLLLAFVQLSRMIYRSKKEEQRYLWGMVLIYFIVYFLSIMFGMSSSGIPYFKFVFRNVMENNPFFITIK